MKGTMERRIKLLVLSVAESLGCFPIIFFVRKYWPWRRLALLVEILTNEFLSYYRNTRLAIDLVLFKKSTRGGHFYYRAANVDNSNFIPVRAHRKSKMLSRCSVGTLWQSQRKINLSISYWTLKKIKSVTFEAGVNWLINDVFLNNTRRWVDNNC